MLKPSIQGTEELLRAVERGVEIIDLGRQFQRGMPQSPNHPVYTHTLPRRHGDMVRQDGASAANDLISFGTHVGTHVDALAHVSQDGLLHGGADAMAEQVGGKFLRGGVQDITPMVTRGILLDIPAVHGWEMCPPAYEIAVEDLQAAVDRQGTPIRPGDVVLIRSGWAQKWHEGEAYLGAATGVPGIGVEGAEWIVAKEVRAAGADTIAFEHLEAGAGHSLLPVHRIFLVENGINLIETMNLESLAALKCYEFLFVLAPLNFLGATGSPVRPLAVIGVEDR